MLAETLVRVRFKLRLEEGVRASWLGTTLQVLSHSTTEWDYRTWHGGN